MCEAHSDCTHASPHLWRQFSFEFTIKSAMTLVVEPPMTVDLYFCSVADACPCSFLFYLFFFGHGVQRYLAFSMFLCSNPQQVEPEGSAQTLWPGRLVVGSRPTGASDRGRGRNTARPQPPTSVTHAQRHTVSVCLF